MREPNLSRSYVTPCIESIKYAETSNGESNNGHQSKSEAYTKMVSGSRRGRDIIKSLVQRPRRTFTKKQIEEHNLGIILIVMSSLFIFCQSFKIIPDMYEIFQCNRLGKYGGNCEMKGPVSILNTQCVRNPDNVYLLKMEIVKFLAWLHLSYAYTSQRFFF